MTSKVSNLKPSTKKLLHVISVTGTYLMIFGFLFILQEVIFGFIPLVRNFSIFGIPVSPVIFVITSMVFINKFVKISSPYKTS